MERPAGIFIDKNWFSFIQFLNLPNRRKLMLTWLIFKRINHNIWSNETKIIYEQMIFDS